MTIVRLLDLQPQQASTVLRLVAPLDTALDPNLLTRLSELGFLPGEQVTVLRRGPGGREPIAVQIADTIFALRAVEAYCVEVGVDVGALNAAQAGAMA